MITWSGRILRIMRRLKYCGWRQVKPNNLLYASWQAFHRGVPAGRYRVWADETRGVFVCPAGAYIIYPGV